MIRIGFWVYYTITIIRDPQNPILIIKAPTLASILVPFWGLPFGILDIELVKPKTGTTMETIGRVATGTIFSRISRSVVVGFGGLIHLRV